MAEGDCCMARHANAVPPWTCDCPCHLPNPDPAARKVYLGDGVYAEFDGYGIVLTTEDGIRETNRIVLEPEVVQVLEEFIREVG